MQVTSLLLLAGLAVLMTSVMETNCKPNSKDNFDDLDNASKKFLFGLFNFFGGHGKKPKPAPSNLAALKGADPLLLSSWQTAYGSDWYNQFRTYLKATYGDNWYNAYRKDLEKKLGAEKWKKIKSTEQYRERYYMIKYGSDWNTHYTDFMTKSFGDDWKTGVQNFYQQNGMTPDFTWSSSNSGPSNGGISGSGSSNFGSSNGGISGSGYSNFGPSNGNGPAPPGQLNGADPLLISSWQTAYGRDWYNPFRNYLKTKYGKNWYHDQRQAAKAKLGDAKWAQLLTTEKYRERYYMVKYGDGWKNPYIKFMHEKFGSDWKAGVQNFYSEHNLTPDFTWSTTSDKAEGRVRYQ